MQVQNNRQLLCTFSNINDYKKHIQDIKHFYELYNKMFVFSNEKNTKEIYITYNVINLYNKSSKFPNTILIHRKKQTNTLYTLNAMNKLIKEETGKLDNTYVVDWRLYSNSLIITGDVSIKIIPLKIFTIFES